MHRDGMVWSDLLRLYHLYHPYHDSPVAEREPHGDFAVVRERQEETKYRMKDQDETLPGGQIERRQSLK